jgi:hypothetical protein
MRIFPATFALSVLINVAALHSVSYVATVEKNHVLRELEDAQKNKQGELQFEFVEAPAGAKVPKPEKAKKISNRDTANQDQTFEKTKAQESPKTKSAGPADQLEQIRGEGGKPVVAKPAQQASEEKIAQPAQEAKSEDKPGTEDDMMMPPQKESPKMSATPEEIPAPVEAPQDKITTHEMSKSASSGAKLYGLTSFEATGSGMGEYMKSMKEKIWLAWFPYIAFKYPQDFVGASAVISFTLNKTGEVKLIKIVEMKGTPLFATFCMEAIQRAGNFGKLSDEILALIGKDDLEIRFGFHYR